MADITLYEGNNELNVQMVPITVVGTTLSGRVTDAETGAGISGAVITASQYVSITETKSYKTTTDYNGFYLITDMAPGFITGIACEAEGYVTVTKTLRIIEGNNELNIQLVSVTAMVTLYMAGVSTQEWMASWYYADRDKFIANPEYTTPSGYPTTWARPNQPCHPPEPIDLNNLIVKIDTYSEVNKCPMPPSNGRWYGSCAWGVFGPFVVEGGGVYTIDITTGALSKR